MGMSIDDLKKECQYCCREIDNSGLEGFICTNRNAIKARHSILCDPKNADEPCSICEYCKPREEPAKQQKMDINECITWLKILRANMNTFPEISAEKKIEALTMAIKALEQDPKWIPVSERLPKAGEYVGNVAKYYLVQNEYGDMLVARYTHSEYWEEMYHFNPIADKIIAWRELPQPYKVGSEDEE